MIISDRQEVEKLPLLDLVYNNAHAILHEITCHKVVTFQHIVISVVRENIRNVLVLVF